MNELSPELIERMVSFVRECVAYGEKNSRIYGPDYEAGPLMEEAYAIAGELPPPIDPDLIEARSVVKATLTPERHNSCNCRERIEAGEWDDGQRVRAALAAIKRGRELEREQSNA